MNKFRVVLLLGNTLRSRAYLNQLQYISDIEVVGVLYGEEHSSLDLPQLDKLTEVFFNNHDILIPDYSIDIPHYFQKNNWQIFYYNSKDVNEEALIKKIDSLDADLVVFSGYGGQILAPSHFLSGAKYLHMHPGYLPIERGSTTIYYSILNKRKPTVSAFYMTAEIDAGDMVHIQQYPSPYRGVNLDQYYDNAIRADCFSKALSAILSGDEMVKSEEEGNEEYYVIHPVLKHIAILSLKQS